MYFWNVKKLIEDLKNEKVTQREKFKCLFVLLLFSLTLPLINTAQRTGWLYFGMIEDLLSLIITATGVLLCYYANRKGDDKEFFDRFVCLALPIGIRVELSAGVLLCLMFGTVAALNNGSTLPILLHPDFKLAYMIFHQFVAICFYLWLRKNILIVSRYEKKSHNI